MHTVHQSLLLGKVPVRFQAKLSMQSWIKDCFSPIKIEDHVLLNAAFKLVFQLKIIR